VILGFIKLSVSRLLLKTGAIKLLGQKGSKGKVLQKKTGSGKLSRGRFRERGEVSLRGDLMDDKVI
jgi:hypothetical protein